ncbi:MAG TPA: substrate-binding domain-containing protein, partial [Roseiflexaceae bacterium]
MQRLSRIVGLGYIAICLATLAGTVLFGPLGYAPLPLVAGPARAPIVVTIWYGTEKREWLEAARTRFEATQPVLGGHPIQIQLKGLGSGEMVDRVVQQSWGSDSPPTAVSPASSLWIELMTSDWAARSGAAPIVAAEPRQLVLTPLVLVAWENRAKALWPGGPRNFWGDLHD